MSASFASADADNIQANDNGMISTDMETVDSELSDLESQTDENILGADGGSGDILADAPGTFAELNTLISSSTGTADFYKNYTRSSSSDTSYITVSKALTIDGHGNTVDGAGIATRLFYVSTSSKVVFQNIIFTGSNANAVYFSGSSGNTFEFINCTFRDNTYSTSSSPYGSAIYAYYEVSNSKFTNVEFIRNQISSTSTSTSYYAYGGALYFRTTVRDTTFDNVNFTENKVISAGTYTGAYGYGGAIYFGSSLTRTNFYNCNFNDNVYKTRGGAIYIAGTSSYNKFINTTFKDNKVHLTSIATMGGAIFYASSSTNDEFTNVNFTNNKATQYAGAIYFGSSVSGLHLTKVNFSDHSISFSSSVYGGAIYVSSTFSGAVFKSVTFDNNVATTATSSSGYYARAGAIYFGNTLSNNKFEDVNFTNNRAGSLTSNYPTSYGGAIFVSSTASGNTFIDSRFEDNYARNYGGAIYFATANTNTFNGTVFKDNWANTYGGAIYATQLGSNNFDYVNFTNNNATTYGGAIYVSSTASGNTFNHTVFEANKVTSNSGYGGAMYIYATSSGNKFDYVDFINNTAKYKGGALYFNNEVQDFVFTNVNFIANKIIPASTDTSNGGGAIYYAAFSTRTVLNHTNFINNSARYGGAIRYGSSSSNEKWQDVEFNHNVAEKYNNYAAYGGAIYYYSTITMTSFGDIRFIDNHAATYGGAVYVASSSVSTSSFKHMSFINNSAQYGGALYFSSISSSTLEDLNFEGNNASTYGGAIYIGTSSGSNFIGLNFTNNNATTYGGAIYISNANGNTFEGLKVTGNNANAGAGIYLSYSSTPNSFADSTFTANIAKSNGGAIYSSPNVIVDDCQFEDNSASYGSAIALSSSNGNANITNSKFKRNKAAVIYASGQSASINVSSSSFEENYPGTGYNGKNIIYVDYAALDVYDSNFTDNTAGSIYIGYGSATNNIVNSNFKNNNVSSGTAVIYTVGAATIIKESEFFNNTGVNGGVLYATGTSTVSLEDDTFEQNTATLGGVAYIVGSANLTVSGSEFTNNSAVNGGAIYNSEATVNITDNSVFTLNRAVSGSAIFNKGTLNIQDSEFTLNKANSTKLTVFYDKFENFVLIEYVAGDNFINAIYSGSDVDVDNVVYYDYEEGICNTDDVTPVRTDTLANQDIKISIYDNQGTLVKEEVLKTDENGQIEFDNDVAGLNRIDVVREEDDYYTGKTATYTYGWGDFDELQSLVINETSGILTLERDYTYTLGIDTITKGIKINKTLIIDGQGHTINALNMSRVFWALSDDIKFININFANATGWNGSAIYGVDVDNIEIINCTFANDIVTTGNVIQPGEGEPIFVEGPDIFFYPSVSFSGGAVYIVGDNLSIDNANFTNFYAVEGGSVYFKGNNAEIKNSNFNMSLAVFGGAIWINGTDIEISNLNFSQTIAELAGGAIFAKGSDYKFNNLYSYMAGAAGEPYVVWNDTYNPDNLADCTFLYTDCYGGGFMNIHADNVEITDSSFNYMEASVGGAILASGENIVIKDSKFNFTGAELGGSIFLDEGAAGTIIDNCSFDDTMYLEAGGAILSYANKTIIKNSRFNNSTARNNAYDIIRGGAVCIIGNDCQVLDSNFTNNNNTFGVSCILWISETLDISSGELIFSEDHGFNGLIDNCIFEDNLGAAISFIASNGTISNSKFNNNIAEMVGAIAHVGYNLNITDSVFSNNFGAYVGAVLLESINTTVTNCIFDSNTGYRLSGALLVFGTPENPTYGYPEFGSNIVADNCTFTNNNAKMGGAVLWAGRDGTINDSRFSNNSAFIGGAVLWLANNGTIIDSNFTDNFAVMGGAVSVGPAVLVNGFMYQIYDDLELNTPYFNDTSIIGSNFINNTAQYAPGVLWVDNKGLIENSTFTDNHFKKYDLNPFMDALISAIEEIEPVYAEEIAMELELQLMDIEWMIEDYYEQTSGAAVYWIGGNGTVNNSTFVGNDATTLTYVEYIQDIYLIFEKDLDQIDPSYNYQSYFEYLEDVNYERYQQTHYYGETIEQWVIGHMRGIISIRVLNETSNTWIVSLFRYISASYYDQYYYTNYGSFAYGYYPTSGLISEEEAEYYKQKYRNINYYYYEQMIEFGQIYVVWGDYKEEELSMASLGGAIYWYAEDGLINNSKFINNRADDAGAVYVGANMDDYASCAIDNSQFIDNIAKYGGGAIVLNGYDGVVNNSVFIGNNVTYDSSDPSDDYFFNMVTGGGAIVWIGPDGKIDNSNFTSNFAEYGGAVVVYGLSYGGIVYGFSPNLAITNSRFDENSATIGGAIVWDSDDGKVINSVFNNNTAEFGGAILVECPYIYITSEFTNNSASEGGALFLTSVEAEINASTFESNKADKGGAIIIIGNETIIHDSEFIKNTALEGGAIWFTGVTAGILDSKFFNNTAVRGGAIYDDGDYLIIQGDEFRFNKADTGSALYLLGSNQYIGSSTFLENQARAAALTVTTEQVGDSVMATAVFQGFDNLINAIYTLSAIELENVEYWATDGITNSDIANPKITDYEDGINITLELYDSTFVPIIAINSTNVAGQASIAITNVKNGRYFVVVRHALDNYYTEVSSSTMVQIGQLDAPINLNVEDIFYNENATIEVSLPFGATGNVTFEIDGVNYTVENLTNAFASVNKSGLAGGVHNVTVYYSGDGTYLANSTKTTFDVKPAPSSVIITCDGGDYKSDIPVNVTVLSDATGSVILTIEDEYGVTLVINDTNELQTVISTLNAGTYNITAYYTGDNNYLASSNYTVFTVNPIELDPSVVAFNVTTDENATFNITVPDDFVGKVNITVGDITKVYDLIGPSQIVFDKLDEGEKLAEFSFYGDANYKPADATATFNVTKAEEPGPVYDFSTIKSDDMVRGFNSPFDYEAEFLDELGNALANTEVIFIVGGQEYTAVTNADGIAHLTTSNLAVGDYTITSVNPVTGEEATNNLQIVKRILGNKDITMDFMDGTSVVVKVIGDDGNIAPEGEIVDICVNNVHYVCKVDANGYARLKINLNPQTYTVTAEYKTYKTTNKLVVKQTLFLVKPAITVKKGNNLVLQAKLKWSNGKVIIGKTIKFRFYGQTYTAKTNRYGIAQVIVKGAVTKKLTAGATYKYSAAYYQNILRGTVKIQK